MSFPSYHVDRESEKCFVLLLMLVMLKVLLPNRNKKVYVDHLLTFIATRQDWFVTERQTLSRHPNLYQYHWQSAYINTTMGRGHNNFQYSFV